MSSASVYRTSSGSRINREDLAVRVETHRDRDRLKDGLEVDGVDVAITVTRHVDWWQTRNTASRKPTELLEHSSRAEASRCESREPDHPESRVSLGLRPRRLLRSRRPERVLRLLTGEAGNGQLKMNMDHRREYHHQCEQLRGSLPMSSRACAEAGASP